MDTQLLERKFARLGARLKFTDRRPNRWNSGTPVAPVSLDIRSDRHGEFFEMLRRPDRSAEVDVLDVRERDRHLLLLVRDEDDAKSKFLCGHDERHWFVEAIPESAPVGTVNQAKTALKPREVRLAEAAVGLDLRHRDRRKNAAFRRQGEWFFLPTPDLVVDARRIVTNEPISRGNGGKPHRVDECFRSGGETVYVCPQFPQGVTEIEYRRLIRRDPKLLGRNWRIMLRNAGVYVRGRVRHADHATIFLTDWHRVVMNTETQARAMQHLTFLD